MSNCVLFSLRFHRLGVSRKVNNDDVGVQEDMLHVSKTILESPSLDAIASFDRATRAELISLAVPGTASLGALILPTDHLGRAYDYLAQRSSERIFLMDAFLVDYDRARSDAAVRLGILFNPDDYPSRAKVAEQFRMSWNAYELGVPGALAEINPQLYEQERQRYCQEWEQVISDATMALTDEFHRLLSHMIERLEPDENGRPKIFRESTVENFRDFLEKFQPRNISNSEELASVARECQELLNTLGGRASTLLRRSAPIRELVAEGMTRVRDSLSASITTAPIRHITPMSREELARCA